MLFDCCALVSTFLRRELVGICLGWLLALGSRLLVFFPHWVPQPSTRQHTSSDAQKLSQVPLVGGWQSGGDNSSSVSVPSAAVGYHSELGLVQPLAHWSLGAGAAGTQQKRQDYPPAILSFLID